MKTSTTTHNFNHKDVVVKNNSVKEDLPGSEVPYYIDENGFEKADLGALEKQLWETMFNIE